ncbi:hypothetical protein O181_040319 [Austropuccinia psidii MF-1]|uniref:Reverse transcriptase domain-containing protein n=1 Tax=Austropuccinia psidii MF-1 TaxID=1389203 RepID=A0A9Q3HFE2_9BASI|nr:hypothetical protein [Austropuccinia psidii MF-1]
MPSQSLLKSRDEVFNEIKDVGEDVAISLLHLFEGDMDLSPFSFHASLEEQWDEEEEPEDIETVFKVVPPAYYQYLDVFCKVKEVKLPPHHTCGHHIELEGLLPPKKDGGLPLCVDYCKLNSVTRKNRYPVPHMNQLLTVFNDSTILSKIDLHGAYNPLKIKEGDEHLTVYRTKYGTYEYLAMPFGLTDSPSSFQTLVNDIFAYLLDIFVVVYLDYIMVLSSSAEEHVKHVASVLQRLRDKNWFSEASKCVFHASSVEYLGYFVPSYGLKMDSSKKLLKTITALTSLLKKDLPIIFNGEALSHFQISKESLTNSPILLHFNPSLTAIVGTEASDYALGAVLTQVNDSRKHPISFDSRKLLPAELNYEIHDKELLDIVWALKHWGTFLLSK